MPPRETAEKTVEKVVEPKEGRGQQLLTIVLLLVVLLLSGGYVYTFFFSNSSRGNAAPAASASQVSMQQQSLDSIVVNLADPGLHRYLRTKITLEYSDPKLATELGEKLYRIKDTVISVLRSKKTDDLQNEEALKRELLTAINAQLSSGQVKALYFEEFLVQ
ncbi:flagellar basal body-associated FliL family protein [Moorella naiadis]|uniref:flagellar basal body-associated FliL family protein n=1 Tax=Moorella naiadis (nom. illeg.) TaxID=3093670 RepID=UPI003D9C9524